MVSGGRWDISNTMRPFPVVSAVSGAGVGAGMSHSQYAGYMADRGSRFNARGFKRRGLDFGDPFLLLLLADSPWGCDGLYCPDDSLYP
jgi:hypothetical protein